MAELRIEIVRRVCADVLRGQGWVDIRTLHNMVQNITRCDLPKGERFGTDIKMLNNTLKQSSRFETQQTLFGRVTAARLKPTKPKKKRR